MNNLSSLLTILKIFETSSNKSINIKKHCAVLTVILAIINFLPSCGFMGKDLWSEVNKNSPLPAMLVETVPSKDITRFTILGVDGAISGTSITLTLPYGTSLSSLTPVITHTGKSISPEAGVAQNFTTPVKYTVTADDTSTKVYTVNVTAAAAYAKEITSFSFPSVPATGVITGTNIAVMVPFGTSITSLVPTIVHTGASINPASGESRSFASPVTYTVTAADGSTKGYVITVTVAAPVFTVTFNSLGADTAANPTSKTVISPTSTIDALPTAPVKVGYDFAGWNTALDGGGTEFTASTTITGNITVYAMWSTTGLGYTLINGNTEYSVDQGTSNPSASIAIPGYWLGKKVTTITTSGFASRSSMPGVTIPGSVTTIGNFAFSGCSGLTSMTIPGSITTIGNYAFNACSGLTSVTIPGSVTTIGDNVFDGCTNLNNLTILNGVTTIGNYMFNNCIGLTSVTIPGSITTIGNNAFNGCSVLNTVTILNGVTTIGDFMFSGCSVLTNVTIPGSVTTIGNSAFMSCSGLTSVTIPGSVITIGDSAFAFCSSLNNLTVPDSVTTIGDYTFDSCTGLTSLSMERMTAPTIGTDPFLGVPGGCTLYIHSTATGYGVLPWTNLTLSPTLP